MHRQSPDENGQQTGQFQQVLNQKHHRNLRQWYQSRTRKAKVSLSLVCGTLIALLLFCLFVTAVSFYGNRVPTISGSQQAHTTTPNSTQNPTSTMMPQLAPPPAQVFSPAPHATAKPSSSPSHGNGTQPNTNSASPSILLECICL